MRIMGSIPVKRKPAAHKSRMAVPTPLLEKVAEGIIRRIKHQYPFATEAVISIYKLEPPIENIQGKIGITMRKEWER